MSDANQLLRCYNRGCGQLYEESKNDSESCIYHPGEPFFHDAYKGWSCCKKKCTDFTEFLNIKGCCKSFHNNVKPPEPEKPVVDKTDKDEVIEYRAPQAKTNERLPRPSEDSPLISLPLTVSSSLEEYLKKLKIDKPSPNSDDPEQPGVVAIGTSCKNKGCKKSYEGEHSNQETCVYHNGFPIFHEGLKYWTCCLKKTTDFNSFLEQIGCSEGQHNWFKDTTEKKKTDCRFDWYQTGNNVYVSLYTKGAFPNKSSIQLSPVKLKILVTYADDCIFEREFTLCEIVDVEKSKVVMSATKVEVQLKKTEPVTWKKLTLNGEF